jgi:hypothetical protein
MNCLRELHHCLFTGAKVYERSIDRVNDLLLGEQEGITILVPSYVGEREQASRYAGDCFIQ